MLETIVLTILTLLALISLILSKWYKSRTYLVYSGYALFLTVTTMLICYTVSGSYTKPLNIINSELHGGKVTFTIQKDDGKLRTYTYSQERVTLGEYVGRTRNLEGNELIIERVGVLTRARVRKPEG